MKITIQRANKIRELYENRNFLIFMTGIDHFNQQANKLFSQSIIGWNETIIGTDKENNQRRIQYEQSRGIV